MTVFRRAKLTAATLLLTAALFAGDIDKAFKYLNTGDYPNARKFLGEVITEEPENPGGNYFMAKYFFAKDNPAHNTDSANVYIKKAAAKLPLKEDDKGAKKLLSLGVRDYTVQALLKDINNEAYAKVEKENTLEAYQHFLDNYTEKGLLYQAENMRNQLAFIRAKGKNSPAAMDEFVKTYPNADQVAEARNLYEKLLYEQTTADKTYASYKKYIDAYPQGQFIGEAKKNYDEKLLQYYNDKHELTAYLEFERNHKNHPLYSTVQDSIYVLATAPATVDAFRNFVKNYSSNPHLKDAWDQLYALYTAEATEEVYRKFADEFPEFPDKDRLNSDISFSQKPLKPFERDGKWGYAYQPTKDSLVIEIMPEYEEAYEFNNGLAAVRVKNCDDSKCTYFYVNKNNQRALAPDFNFAGNFHNGYAVVGVGNCESEEGCNYGIIDVRGKYMVAPTYDVIEDQTEGAYLASKNDRFGFIDNRGNVLVSLKYSNALPYSQDVAAVAIDENWFFIDKDGRQLFINRFMDVSSFSDSLCAVTLDGENWGYINMAGEFVIQPIYEAAEDFETGFAVVSKKEKDPKNKGLFIGQRYKIDKTGKVIEKLTAPKAPSKSTKRKTKK